MRVFLALLGFFLVGAETPAEAANEWHTAAIGLTDARREVASDISDNLVLRVRNAPHAKVSSMGWTVGVYERPIDRLSENLLLRARHGADPSDVFAGNVASGSFPSERLVPVRGHPYQVRIRELDAVTKKEQGVDVFVGGTLEVAWRRVDSNAPRIRRAARVNQGSSEVEPAKARFSCKPDIEISLADGWIDVGWVRVRIWDPWVHDARCAQLDDDPEEEFFVISRTTGTGPYYRIQILDFKRDGETSDATWGVLSWSYYSDGKPKVEDGKVFLGELPVDRDKGPSNYRAHRLTTDGLMFLEADPDCLEIAARSVAAAGAGEIARFPIELFGDRHALSAEITRTVPGGATSLSNDTCSRFVTVKNSEGEPLSRTDLAVLACGDASFRSGIIWHLLDDGYLAALEFGNATKKHAAGDLHFVYLGREGGVWSLASFASDGLRWGTRSERESANKALRVFQLGDSVAIAVESRSASPRGALAARNEAADKAGVRWFELPPRRNTLLPLAEDRVARCKGGNALPAETSRLAGEPVGARETFLRAYHDAGLLSFHEPKGLILFNEPLPIDWSTLAPRELADLEYSEIQKIYPSEAGIRDYCGCAQIEYKAALQPELTALSCQLLSPGGGVPLTLEELRGTVSLKIHWKSKKVTQRTHYGSIVARRDDSGELAQSGGFVVCSSAGSSPRPASGSVDVTDLVHSTSERLEIHQVLPEGSSDADRLFWTIASQYAFELGSAKYVFIEWSPDEDGHELFCEFRYSIATLTQPPRIVTWNYYGCDV